ncbi:MAG: hypothetical protein JWR35_1960 [Marmoricola sp.]|jgi:hypothetical protein|nr:hypothetical protein [Marmoricola sp.]
MTYPADRAELEKMVGRWIEANSTAQDERDWTGLAEFYAEDATYGWMYSPDEHFMCVGRDQIREFALGTEMAGLDGWQYPYVTTLIDEKQQMVVGFWRQVSDVTGPDGKPIEIHGIGGSWFKYGGDFEWAWQRDWFDLNSAGHAFLALLETGKASEAMVTRMGLHGPSQPGHFPLTDLPAPLWPVPTQ